MGRQRASLYAEIASQLAKEIPNMPGTRLPSQRSLFRRFAVSQGTMTRAVRLLERWGLVRLAAPGRVLISGRTEEVRAAKTSATGTVSMHIRRGIRECRYRRGQALPKMQSLASEFSVSQHTVLRAYHQLGREKILHRKGKRWIVGQPEVHVPGSPWKTVVVITERPSSWNSLDSASRTRGFCMAFSREAQAHRMRQVTGCLSLHKEAVIPFLRGMPDIATATRSLGEVLVGVLLIVPRRDMPDSAFHFLIDLMYRQRKPLVWLDSYGEGTEGLFLSASSGRSRSKWFTRCHFSEECAATLALKRLVDAGHRRVGFLTHGEEPWAEARLDAIVEAAAKISEDIDQNVAIVTHRAPRLLYQITDGSDVRQKLESTLQSGSTPASEHLKRTLHRVMRERRILSLPDALHFVAREFTSTPPGETYLKKDDIDLLSFASLLSPYLADSSITAVITANDAKAVLYYRYMLRLGIEIPSRWSIISFDNYAPDLPAYPITTVDFGFDDLGYSAFHVLAGHIPVNRNRHGDIAAVPRLVERGSIATVKPTNATS